MTVADIEPDIADGCAQFGSCFCPEVVVLIVAASSKRMDQISTRFLLDPAGNACVY